MFVVGTVRTDCNRKYEYSYEYVPFEYTCTYVLVGRRTQHVVLLRIVLYVVFVVRPERDREVPSAVGRVVGTVRSRDRMDSFTVSPYLFLSQEECVLTPGAYVPTFSTVVYVFLFGPNFRC